MSPMAARTFLQQGIQAGATRAWLGRTNLSLSDPEGERARRCLPVTYAVYVYEYLISLYIYAQSVDRKASAALAWHLYSWEAGLVMSCGQPVCAVSRTCNVCTA